MSFPEKIRQTRERAGLSQTTLAERAGLTQSALSHIETGTRFAGAAVARSLCRELALGPPWPAVAFLEEYEARMLRDFGITPEQTQAEIERAFAECKATGEDATTRLPESLDQGSAPPRVTWNHPNAAAA